MMIEARPDGREDGFDGADPDYRNIAFIFTRSDAVFGVYRNTHEVVMTLKRMSNGILSVCAHGGVDE